MTGSGPPHSPRSGEAGQGRDPCGNLHVAGRAVSPSPDADQISQVFDLVGWIVVSGPGGIVANLRGDETDGQDGMSQIFGAKTGTDYQGAA